MIKSEIKCRTCPECGSPFSTEICNDHREQACDECHQSWFVDIDYPKHYDKTHTKVFLTIGNQLTGDGSWHFISFLGNKPNLKIRLKMKQGFNFHNYF